MSGGLLFSFSSSKQSPGLEKLSLPLNDDSLPKITRMKSLSSSKALCGSLTEQEGSILRWLIFVRK